MEERSKGERIAYLEGYIIKLKETHQDPWEQEMVQVCVEALKKQIDKILNDD